MSKQTESFHLSTTDKRRRVMRYFDAIGPRYDLADDLMSFGLHFFWRRASLRQLDLKEGYRILDLCGGTGEFARRIAKFKIQGLSVVCDFSRTMMMAGKNKGNKTSTENKIRWVQGDAERLGFADGIFDAAVVGYGVRNLVNLPRGLREIKRVLIPGGKLVVMEFSIPRSPWIRTFYHWYSFKIMPPLGKAITGQDAPFFYLAESIRSFPSPEAVRTILETAGFRQVTLKSLSGGIVTVYSAISSP